MTDRIMAVDGKPPIGDQYRFVQSPLGKGLLAPYMTFDPEYGENLRHSRELSRITGIIPMALILPGAQQVVASSMYTHETPYTQALEALSVAENAGLAPSGSVRNALVEMINGNVIIEKIDFDTEQSD